MAEKREARAVPEGERMGREEMMGGTVMPMPRAGFMPAWLSRISWGSVLAGTLIAVATQLVLASFVTWIGLAAATPTTVAELRGVLSGVGFWTAVTGLISLFVGGWAASRLASIQFSSDGLWHGATVWAFTIVAGIILSGLGFSGLLGFGANAMLLLRAILPANVTIAPADLRAIANTASAAAGWFLLGSLLALASALLGGWLGSRRLSRQEAMMREAGKERMAA